MKEGQEIDVNTDRLGMLFRDLCEDIDSVPIERMHQAISTPEYFAASVHQSIPQDSMMNFGANVFYSVVFCTKNMPLPSPTEPVPPPPACPSFPFLQSSSFLPFSPFTGHMPQPLGHLSATTSWSPKEYDRLGENGL